MRGVEGPDPTSTACLSSAGASWPLMVAVGVASVAASDAVAAAVDAAAGGSLPGPIWSRFKLQPSQGRGGRVRTLPPRTTIAPYPCPSEAMKPGRPSQAVLPPFCPAHHRHEQALIIVLKGGHRCVSPKFLSLSACSGRALPCSPLPLQSLEL